MDKSGKILFYAPEFKGYAGLNFSYGYSYSYGFSNGYVPIIYEEVEGVSFINKNGEIVNHFDSATNIFLSKNNDWLVVDTASESFGIKNVDNKWVVEPKYQEIKIYGKRIIVFKDKGKYGLLDSDGTVLVNPTFIEVKYIEKADLISFSNGWATQIFDYTGKSFTVEDIKKLDVYQSNINKTEFGNFFIINDILGNKLFQIDRVKSSRIYWNYNEGITPIVDSVGGNPDKWGYMDLHGEVIINNQFDWSYPFVNGYGLTKTGDYYRFVDSKVCKR